MDEPKDFRILDVPGYLEWSKKKLREGESEALIAHLDATCVWVKPSELGDVTINDFEELLDDLKSSLDLANGDTA